MRDFHCNECDFKACNKEVILQHSKSVHSKIRDFKCNECEYKANRKETILIHQKAVHLKLKDIKCNGCPIETIKSNNKSFSTKC